MKLNYNFEPVCYTLGQASQMLQVSESTIRRRIHEGIIPRTKICGKILIPAWFFNEIRDNTKSNEESKLWSEEV